MKLIQFILLLIGSILIIGTSFGQTTASKEIEHIKQYDIDPTHIYDLAITNIVECKTDKQKVSTVNYYCELLPVYYKCKLKLWFRKINPHLKYQIVILIGIIN